MQIKDDYLLSKKQSEDEKIAEIGIKYAVIDWFNDVTSIILDTLIKNDNSVPYLYQIEEIVRLHKDDYMEILTNHIQDYYFKVSETAEAQINNKVSQKTLDNTILLDIAGKVDEQSLLDDWLYDYNADNAIRKEIRKKLRYNGNVQTSLDRYTQQKYNINFGSSFNPTPLGVAELLEFEVDEAVIEYMADNVFVASESTLERVTQEIYDIIRESYAEQGNGIDKVTEDIQEAFNTLTENEAERIARTETLKAQGSATYNRLINNSNVEYFQWLSTDDDRTRESHIELNGEITYADGTGIFSNGLRFPGDTNGDIEEWINCRCTLVAYIPEVGFVPPPGASSWFEDEMLFDTTIDIPEVYIEMDDYLASYW